MNPSALFPLLLAGHAIGDWIVQTDAQAAAKSWPPPPEAYNAALRSLGVYRDGQEPRPEEIRAATRKLRRISWQKNQAHVLNYHLSLAAACFYPLWGGNPGLVLAVLAFSWALHSFIDRRWPVRWLLKHTRSSRFSELPWGVLAADQALHIATLAVVAAFLAGVVR